MTFKIISRGIKNIDFNNHQLRCLRSNIYGSMKMYMEITINTSQASQNQHWVNARFKLKAKNNCPQNLGSTSQRGNPERNNRVHSLHAASPFPYH